MSQQVTIRSISIEGFKSYIKPVTFQFNNVGLHLITGKNGDGKSSLFSALVWCLYKTNLNNTNNDKIATYKWLRGKDFKGTRVRVILGAGKYKYLIARHIDYKGTTVAVIPHDALLIFRKEKIDKSKFSMADCINEDVHKDDQQEYINKLLGIDATTFLNSVLFGQRMNRLMDSKNSDKRDLFERLFDTDFIDTLKDNAAKKQTDVEAIITELNTKIDKRRHERQFLNTQLTEYNELIAGWKANRLNALQELKTEYGLKKEDIEALRQIITLNKGKKPHTPAIDMTALNTRRESALNAHTTAKIERDKVHSDLMYAKRDFEALERDNVALWERLKALKDVCPVCGSKLKPEKVSAAKTQLESDIKDNVTQKRDLEAKIRKLDTSLAVCDNTIKSATTEVENALDALNDANKIQRDSIDSSMTVQERRLVTLETELAGIKKAYQTKKAEEPPKLDTDKITLTLATIAVDLEAAEKSLRIKNNYLKRLLWWKQAFGANGLKAYIFSASLNHLNSCIAAYSDYFGIRILFGIDLSKSSTPFFCKVTLDGEHDVDYESLSGGEKQRVDICIAFGLQDASAIKTTFNLSIFDEPEQNLDAIALETLDMLLRIRAEKQAVYVISHNSQMDLAGATSYEVRLENKTSIIE